jgi:hypothetical protein
MTPGSNEAIKKGCTCPILDNAHGAGYIGGVKDDNGETVYVITEGCPVHNELYQVLADED